MPTHVVGARLGAGVLAASAALCLGMASANAADVAEAEVQGAKLNNENVKGLKVGLEGSDHKVVTMLIGLALDDAAKIQTYCVELDVDLKGDYPDMTEVPWDQYPDPDSLFHQNRANVNWILHHSFPALGLPAIEAEVGVPFNGGLSKEEAIAATQASIWHYTDGANLTKPDSTDAGAESDADVTVLYEYLTGPANVGIGDPPTPELSLNPASLSGEAGTEIGPFVVSTTAEVAALESVLPEGVELVDAQGAPLPADVTDGTEIFVSVPDDAESGEGSIKLSASASLSLGRLWVGTDFLGGNPKARTQSLILAASEITNLAVEGTVDWVEKPTPTESPTPTETPTPTESPTPTETPTPTPTETPTPSESPTPSETPTPTPTETPELPDTGSGASTPVLIGAALAVAAGALMLLRRRVTA